MNARWIRINQVLLIQQDCYVAEKERKSKSVSILERSTRIVNRKNFTCPNALSSEAKPLIAQSESLHYWEANDRTEGSQKSCHGGIS